MDLIKLTGGVRILLHKKVSQITEFTYTKAPHPPNDQRSM